MATRDLSSAVAAALDDDVVYPFFAVDLMFEGDPQYIWTGIGTKTIDGKDYEGLGELLSVALVEETADIAAKGASITISGIPKTTNVSLALNTAYQGRIGRIHFGVMGAQTAYTEIFSGYMDEMNIVEGPDTSTIEINIENKLVDLERPRVARYTSAYQRNKFNGDAGLDFVESLQNKEITWGKK
jgi:hypothetical protein